MRSKGGLVLLIAGCGLIAVVSSAAAEAADGPPPLRSSSGPASVTEAPPPPPPPPPPAAGQTRVEIDAAVRQKPDLLDDPTNHAVVAYAKQKNVSATRAAAELRLMHNMTSFADSHRADADFAGFRVIETPNGIEGQLATTSHGLQGFDSTRNVRTLPAAVSESERLSLFSELAAVARANGVPDASAVTVDPFSSELTVWRRPQLPERSGPMPAEEALRLSLLRSEPKLAADSTVTVRIEPTSRPATGGQAALRSSNFLWFFNLKNNQCTTGFGIINYTFPSSTRGYLTAGLTIPPRFGVRQPYALLGTILTAA